MKQSKIIDAYNMSTTLSECEITDIEQWEVYKLRKILRPHVEFQQEREMAIKEKYIPFADEKGALRKDKVQDYINEINSIGNLDVELEEFSKPKIKITKGITCKIIEPLEDFVEFLPPD